MNEAVQEIQTALDSKNAMCLQFNEVKKVVTEIWL